MGEILVYALPFAAFLAIYAMLREREKTKSGVRPPLESGWIAAITACAAVAILAGLLI